jgi:hypothetical protein
MFPEGFKTIIEQIQKIKEKIEEIQEQASSKTVEASAGGGMVKVTANGKGEITSITIDPEVVNPDDIDMLQDLIIAAVNQAVKNGQEIVKKELKELSHSLQLPKFLLPI